MSKQNRVTPHGTIIATAARGTLMGNRGRLHNAQQQIVRTTDRKAWIICKLEYKGRRREIMSPGSYTELFFLDEATALSAGHRPCGECDRARFNTYKSMFMNANSDATSLSDIDAMLNRSRCLERSHMPSDAVCDLPDGCFVELDGETGAWLKKDGFLYRWNPAGYSNKREFSSSLRAHVITPTPIVNLLRAGYTANVHRSVDWPSDTPEERHNSGALNKPDSNVQHASVAVAIGQSKRVTAPPAPAAPEAVTTFVSDSMYKLEKTPAGRNLNVYFAGILRVTGMESGGIYPLKKFLKNFRTHQDNGFIEATQGGFRLTQKGMQYFKGRNEDKGISDIEINSMVEKIRRGGAGWVSAD